MVSCHTSLHNSILIRSWVYATSGDWTLISADLLFACENRSFEVCHDVDSSVGRNGASSARTKDRFWVHFL